METYLVELLSPCPCGPGAGGGLEGDGALDKPVVAPGLSFVVFRIEKNIPITTNIAIAAMAPIMPPLLRLAACVVGGFIESRAALSFLMGPPGVNSVAMKASLGFKRPIQAKPERSSKKSVYQRLP